jgi:hypothetical protein
MSLQRTRLAKGTIGHFKNIRLERLTRRLHPLKSTWAAPGLDDTRLS